MSNVVRSLYGFEMRDGRRKRGEAQRATTGKRKVGDCVELAQRHHEMLNLHALGLGHAEIAERFNVTKQSVSQIVNSSLGQQKVALIRGARDADTLDIKQRLEALCHPAVDVYEEILAADSEASLGLKKKTADTVLMQIGGYEAPKRFEGVVAHLDSATIDILKQRGRAAGIIIDSTPT